LGCPARVLLAVWFKGFWAVSRSGLMREGVLWAVSWCACVMVRALWLGSDRVLNYSRTSAACFVASPGPELQQQ
jgi:hypothetical protein